MDIVLGDHNRWFMDGKEQIISASHVIPHPNYESWLVNNDIMLIKLSKPAIINEYVKPVALPTACAPAGITCTVSGWGVTMSSCEYQTLPVIHNTFVHQSPVIVSLVLHPQSC